MSRRRFATPRFILASLMAIGVPVTAAPAAPGFITAAPPADFLPRPDLAKSASARLLSNGTGPARRVALAAPTEADAAGMKAHNRGGRAATAGVSPKGRPLAIGYGREVPAELRRIELASLDWIDSADGGRVARIEITSPGAAAVRVAFALASADPNITVRYAGSNATADVHGPTPASALVEDTQRFGQAWTPVLEGERAIIEIHAAAGAELAHTTLAIARISHLVVAGARLQKLSAKDAADIGYADFCETDLACITPQSTALVNAGKAVAKMVFAREDGIQYLCTGQLLNDTAQSFTPYFLVANHCINTAAAARTLNTYWFFDAVACGRLTVPPYALLGGGAALLGRSEDHDWSIVRLNRAPPAGARFAAWNADPVPAGAAVTVIHHPEGDLKKVSLGISFGDVFVDEQIDAELRPYGRMNVVRYGKGSTEGGSSGSGLLTYLSSGDYYEVRGGLSYGTAACRYPDEPDYYTRVADALPLMREYLTPNAGNPSGTVVVVEFYNRTLDHYFMSSDPTEINNLDTGVQKGWERTGLRFLAYGAAGQGRSPVCRFYEKPGFGDSHFYSADPQECAETAAKFGDRWIYESPSVFYLQLPNKATGLCPAATNPVWRYFRAAVTNHRYTDQVAVRDELSQSAGWIPEGYGPGPYYPIMCAPQV
jgi:lysyl endopeptidase